MSCQDKKKRTVKNAAQSQRNPRSEGLILTNRVYANVAYFCLNRSLSGIQDNSKETLFPMSRMIRTHAQVGEQQLLAAWMVASAVWFDRHKNGINVFQSLRIAGFQDPALLAHIVFIKNAET